MKKQLKDVSVADIYHAFGEKDEQDIPSPCQKRNICSKDIHRVQNESVSWLKKTTNGLPIWSRLNNNNCMGTCRESEIFKIKNYDVEIPGRLLSMFGSHQEQTMQIIKMTGLENFQLVACAMALCSALKYDLMEWSPKLLDNIITQAALTYADILLKLNILDRHFSMAHLNQVFQFQGIDYQVTAQQVATGFLYIPFGYNEFNLSRALYWFFSHYQFGILQCCNRSLAFGFTLNSPYGFFMYDCQTRGPPLFKDQDYNSYILRSTHLQILLYCIIVTLNITLDRVKFFMYSVDVRIRNQFELKKLKKEMYVPTISNLDVTSMLCEKKVDCGTDNKKLNNSEQILAASIEEEKQKQTLKDVKNMKKVTPVQVATEPYILNQKRLDKEVIKNNRTTIKKAHRIFNAIIPKTPKPPPKTNAIKATPNIVPAKVTPAAATPKVADKKPVVNTPKPPKVTLERRTLPKTSVEKPPAVKAIAPKPLAVNTVLVQKNSIDVKPISPGQNILEKKPSVDPTATIGKNTSVEKAEKPISPPSPMSLSTKKIRIDPKKKYYIIAVPKENVGQNVATKKTNDKSILKSSQNKAPPLQDQVKVNIKRVTTLKSPSNDNNNRTYNIVQKEEINLDLERSDSEKTITNGDGIINPEALKVFLVNNSSNCGLLK